MKAHGDCDRRRLRTYSPKIRVTIDPDGEVAIYGNRDGLRWLARRCLVLSSCPAEGHIHLRNEGVALTNDSNDCTICYDADYDNLSHHNIRRHVGIRTQCMCTWKLAVCFAGIALTLFAILFFLFN